MSAGTTTHLPRSDSDPVGGAGGWEGSRLAGVPRRRRVPYLLVGVLLIIGCATGGVVVATQLGEREAVLVLAEPVTAGQEITAAVVREVSMAVDPGVEVLAADALEEGWTAAYSLPAGAILTAQVVGEPAVPPSGQAVTAVALERGQFPPGLQPGHTVQVVAASAEDTGSSVSWTAVVTAVDEGGESGETVVTVQMEADDAQEMAAWPAEDLHVVQVAGAGS